jgi:cytoskeletal protein CcmA (bactofilin family)
MNAFRRTAGRWGLALALCAALVALFVVAPARAADVRGGSDIVIGREEVIVGDLYVFGNTVTIDGTIKGDLIAAGGTVTINGTVEGDLLAAAQGVVLNGTGGDDMRAAGQAILLGPHAHVTDDLAVAGLSLENQSGSVVQGDLLVGAYQALLAGEIGRNVTGSLDRMELRGTVGHDLNVEVGSASETSAMPFTPAGRVPIPSVPPSLTVAESARIGGMLIYRSIATAPNIAASRVGGQVAFEPLPAQPVTSQPAIPGLAYLQRHAALLLIGLLLIWLAPGWTRRMADTVEAKPLPSLGWGLVAFGTFLATVIGVLVATILLAIGLGFLSLGGLVGMIVVGGVLLNAALILGYIAFTAYIAEIVVGYVAGRWLLRRVRPAWAEQPIIPLALGAVLYILVRAIPVLGVLLALGAVLLGLGGLWQWGHTAFTRAQPHPAPIVGLQPA